MKAKVKTNAWVKWVSARMNKLGQPDREKKSRESQAIE